MAHATKDELRRERLRENDAALTAARSPVAVLALLMRMSRTEFVLAAHEELDASYRLTKVEERRALPDVELLLAQLAAFCAYPATWWRSSPAGGGGPAHGRRGRDPARAALRLTRQPPAPAGFGCRWFGCRRRAGRRPECRAADVQRGVQRVAQPGPRATRVLGTLVRQTEITIAADGQPAGNGPS